MFGGNFMSITFHFGTQRKSDLVSHYRAHKFPNISFVLIAIIFRGTM